MWDENKVYGNGGEGINGINLPSSTLALRSSFSPMTTGNLPHLASNGPPNLGSCLTRDSDTKTNLYLAMNLLSSFPFLSAGSTFFFKESASINSILAALHLSA